MTIDELYEKLEDAEFQDSLLGSIFYNVYIFPYDIRQENQVVASIKKFKKQLIRPKNNLDILIINVFDLLCDYLFSKPFGKHGSLLDYYQKKEAEGFVMTEQIATEASKAPFLKALDDKVRSFIDDPEQDKDNTRSIVIMYGFSQVFPYLRVNQFLSNYEQFNTGEDFKLIVCYPGQATDTSFSLFGELQDNHTYRAQILN